MLPAKLSQILIGDVFSKGLLFIVNLVLIALLPISEYAKFSLLLNALLLGYQLVCSGVDRLYIADHGHFGPNSFRVLWFLIAVYSIVFAIYLYDSVPWGDVGLFVIGLVLLSIYQFRRIGFQQQLRFSWFSIAEIIKNGGWLVLVIALYLIDAEISSTSALCAFIASVLLGLVVIPRDVNQEKMWSANPVSRITFSVIIGRKEVFFYALLAAVIPFLPILLANHERNEELLATYGAAMRYQAVLGIFVYALSTVSLPMLATANNRQTLLTHLRLFYRGMPLVIAIGILAVGVVILSIPLIDGGKYPKLPLVFLILSGCPLLSLVAVPAINLLLVQREYKQITLCMVLGFIVNIASYALMQGSLGGYEIAASSLLGYAMVNIALIQLGWAKFRAVSHR